MAAAANTQETTLFDTSETLNAIVARHPRALTVFKAFGLDTCCGGGLPLSVAAEHHALDLMILVGALRDDLAEEA